MSQKVWVTWKYDSNNWLFGKVTNLNDNDDVDDLRKAFVKQQNLNISPDGVSVSAAGVEGEALEEDKGLQPYFVSNARRKPGPGQSKNTALVLTVPRPVTEQQDNLYREKKRRLDDLLFYHRAVLETGTSKSVKLLRVRQFPGGSKRCFLCGNLGTNGNKIEASHVLQKQDIYATAGDEGLETLDILKGWTEGRGWNRPFKMHDAMNLIWLCHTHNLAFDSHQFGLCLGGLDNSIRFCSFSDEYKDLVNSANERLQDTSQPFFDMSYVSRRAVGMRLYKAQQSGYYFNHNDPDAWQTVVRLSNAASMKEGEDDTEG
mmetsp:Transcript_23737/g.36034  ORF Transcript_23737/g.36034 Transcript_23737/m.36034 type:complete len:316 (-) Transcript_23737:1586-2533(-)